MNASTATGTAAPSAAINTASDSDDLAAFGYKPQLHRSLGKFASFAAGFSFVSILTTIFQLFAFGFSFGVRPSSGPGPSSSSGNTWWRSTSPSSPRYPISGAIYQWARRLGGAAVGWFAGWFMIIAQIVTASAAPSPCRWCCRQCGVAFSSSARTPR